MTEHDQSWEQRAVDEIIAEERRKAREEEITREKARIVSHGYAVSDERCTWCGERLYRRRANIWSHDRSLKIGYTLYTICPHCGFSDVYHDVE